MFCQRLDSEPEVYCVHKDGQRSVRDTVAGATVHDYEQPTACDTRKLFLQQYEPGNFRCLFSVRVDDIKSIASKEGADPLFVHVREEHGAMQRPLRQCSPHLGSSMRTNQVLCSRIGMFMLIQSRPSRQVCS